MNQKRNNRFMPIIMAVCVVVGILIGTFYANHFSGNRLSIINTSSNKLNNLLHIIDDQYVDTVNVNDLVEKAVPQILAELDPHSVYISAKDVQMANDDLRGSFSGVGIEFIIRQDTLRVQQVIGNGPAERAGVIAGDKIVKVDGEDFTGKTLTNEVAMHKLKGPKDTKVKLGIMRYGEKKIHEIVVTRGEIPTKSITAAYMLDKETWYIRIKNFGENTYPELLIALAKLSQEDFQNLTIDLRGNTGGYLQSAVQIANEFLPKNRLIVYTQGRKSQRQEYRSDGRGSYQRIPLVILIDEGSASASEILAGAIQDNDRGTIIGRRSFGKGYEHGEFFSQDSIKHEGKEYHTAIGRPVFGGGGITPDIFVAEDTADVTSYYKQASMTGLIIQYAYEYTDANRNTLKNISSVDEMTKYLQKQNTVDKFATFADKNGLKRRNLMIQKSHKLLERYINSRIIYNMMSEEAWMKYLNTDDPAVNETLKVFRENNAFPKAPEKK